MSREAVPADVVRRLPPGPEGMIFRLEIRRRDPKDPEGSRLVRAARAHGLSGLRACRVARLCFLQAPLSFPEVKRLARLLLADPITERFHVTLLSDPSPNSQWRNPPSHWIEVTWQPGVTDPTAESLLRAAREAGFDVRQAAWGLRFLLWGELSESDLQWLATELCCNPVIQRYAIDQAIAPPFLEPASPNPVVEILPIREASEADLIALSERRRLALDLEEMRAIQDYFRRLGRDPTDVELETLAQTWSEHCAHKTFKARIRYTGPAPGAAAGAPTQTIEIDGLLRTYIQAATEQAARPWVRSAFVDNAGIIALDDRWDLALKVETHNHPSAVEPFGGASTGVGGVIRDILGVSARPVANLDVLCFAPPDLPDTDRLPGTLHPQRIIEGVIRGIEDYGNKMGIPTVSGAVFYHPGYRVSPLVFCGCLGILPRGSHPTTPQPGDLIVVIGGRTGRDGLGGATFSSAGLDPEAPTAARQAVQMGHPILEKQLLEVILQAREERLYHAITDCGAGGLSSAVGEMARRLGACVHLDRVPLKDRSLRPWEIWLSESQERMVLAIPPEHWSRFQEICALHGVEAAAIGTFEASGRLQLFYRGHPVGELEMGFLHEGRPPQLLEARWAPPLHPPPSTRAPSPPRGLHHTLLALLGHPNIRSREEILRRYDHEVQGATAIKPLVGAAHHGPSDAVVLVPPELLPGGELIPGIALAVGLAPQYGERDPYCMAWAAIDEAFRNLVAVGADPDSVALLDNFCWGDPHHPEQLGALVRCAQGCFDAARAYQAPFISGKDSLHNVYRDAEGRAHAIPGTLLITAVGRVPDVRQAVTMDLKRAGDWLYLVGDTRPELGQSHYALIGAEIPQEADHLPQPVPQALARMRALHRAMAAGLVQACHDLSEGGLGVALAEMTIAGRLGAWIDLRQLPGAGDLRTDEEALFSESLSRFLVEVRPEDAAAFEACLAGHPVARIGAVTADGRLRVIGRDGSERICLPIEALERAWRGEPAPAISPAPTSTPYEPPAVHVLRRPRVLILQAPGTNREREAALACQQAGGEPEIVPLAQLLRGERDLLDYAMLVLPGGFSYGDDLGAGTLWALDLRLRLGDAMERFIASGRPVLGICNGFQALVKGGWLPGPEFLDPKGNRMVTLAPNASGRFECRWVWLRANPRSPCLFTEGIEELLHCPVAHGEGRFMARSEAILDRMEAQGLIALTYVDPSGKPAGYPFNPNGSQRGIAGICNPAGNVLGLMPHPEDHLFPWQHPRWRRGERGGLGLVLFQNALRRC